MLGDKVQCAECRISQCGNQLTCSSRLDRIDSFVAGDPLGLILVRRLCSVLSLPEPPTMHKVQP